MRLHKTLSFSILCCIFTVATGGRGVSNLKLPDLNTCHGHPPFLRRHLIARAPIRQGGCWSVVDHIEILKPPTSLRASEWVVISGNDIESIRLKWYVFHILTKYTMIKLLFGAAKLWSRAYKYIICIETNLEQSICIYSILSLYTYLTWANYDQFFLIMFRDFSFPPYVFSNGKSYMPQLATNPLGRWGTSNVSPSTGRSLFIGWWCLQMVDGLWWFFHVLLPPRPKNGFF